MNFPSELFAEIAKGKAELENGGKPEYQDEIEQLHREIEQLTQRNNNASTSDEDSRAQTLARQKQQLMEEKRSLLNDKSSLEREIAQLRRQIAAFDAEKESQSQEDALAILQSIAPVKVTELSGTTVRGVIAFGKPETTTTFSFDTARDNPNEFWATLARLSQ